MGYNSQQQANEFSRQRREIIEEWNEHQGSAECYHNDSCKQCGYYKWDMEQLEAREKEFWKTSN